MCRSKQNKTINSDGWRKRQDQAFLEVKVVDIGKYFTLV